MSSAMTRLSAPVSARHNPFIRPPSVDYLPPASFRFDHRSAKIAAHQRGDIRMPDPIRYGPDNPHPLSTRRTELVWEGKYDEYGNRREVDIAGAAMPLQKIETVDEPRASAEGQGKLFQQ